MKDEHPRPAPLKNARSGGRVTPGGSRAWQHPRAENRRAWRQRCSPSSHRVVHAAACHAMKMLEPSELGVAVLTVVPRTLDLHSGMATISLRDKQATPHRLGHREQLA